MVKPTAPAPTDASSTRRWILRTALLSVLAVVGGLLIWGTIRGSSPQSLRATTVKADSVTLAWDPPGGTPPDAYLVSRNGQDVARVAPGKPYTDVGLDPLTAYRFSVRAVIGDEESPPTATVAVTTLPWGPEQVTPAAVFSTVVRLAWTVPRGTPPEQFVVQRDGRDLATLPGTVVRYTDATVTAGATLRYTVLAVQKGLRSQAAPELAVVAADPPVADSRLVGTWVVDATVTENNGTQLTPGALFVEDWTFAPSCAVGACGVTLTGTMADKPFTSKLTRTGERYTGSATANITTCDGRAVTNTLKITLTMARAGLMKGVWRASGWTGTLTMYTPYTVNGDSYCGQQDSVFALASALGRKH